MMLSNREYNDLRGMINEFRVSDLQSLLGTVQRNRSGRKTELQQRAVDVLKNAPNDVNFDLYCRKIRDIYKAIQDEVKQNQIGDMRQLEHGAASMGVSQMNIPAVTNRGGLQVSAGPGQQHILQPPRLPPPFAAGTQFHQQQQLMSGMQRPVGYSGGNVFSNYAPNIQQHPQLQQRPKLAAPPAVFSAPVRLEHLKLADLPFFKKFIEIMAPTTLVPTNPSTIPQNPKLSNHVECVYKFRLTIDSASELSAYRDVSDGKAEYENLVLLRICSYEIDSGVQNDLLPFGLIVRMNGKQVPLPPIPPNTKPGTDARRIPRQINLTSFAKLSPLVENIVTINWLQDHATPSVLQNYAATIYLAHKLTAEDLLTKLKSIWIVPTHETKQLIIDKLKVDEQDDDVATTSLNVSLNCPLSACRLSLPARGTMCKHLQCFDATFYIQLNEKKPNWICPICNKHLPYNTLRIYQYFIDVLESDNLSSDCTEIQLLADGTWRVCDTATDDDKKKEVSSGVTSKECPPDSVEMIPDEADECDANVVANAKEAENNSRPSSAASASSAPVNLADVEASGNSDTSATTPAAAVPSVVPVSVSAAGDVVDLTDDPEENGDEVEQEENAKKDPANFME